MMSSRSLLGAALFAASLLAPTPASAAFLFCNKTQSLVEAAFGYREDANWVSEGWWQIQPGQCARVFPKPLTQRFYFYYARTLSGPVKEGQTPPVWAGKYAFCVDSKAFKADGDQNCESRNLRVQGFQEIDVGANQRDYTLTFKDSR